VGKKKRKNKPQMKLPDEAKHDVLLSPAKHLPKPTFDKRDGYKKPAPPETDEQLLHQLNTMRSFIGSIVKCISKREHETAYVLIDRTNELGIQIQKAMEDLEP
jgi:hypothetical protein